MAEFWEYEYAATPAGIAAEYTPGWGTPAQREYLQEPVYRPLDQVTPDRPLEAGIDITDPAAMFARYGPQFLGTAPFGIDPKTGQPLDIAMAGIHPAAFLGPALTAIGAGITGALLPVGPGGMPPIAPSIAGPYGPSTAYRNGQIAVNGVPISGPGVPEPPGYMVRKHWNVKVDSREHGTFRMYYWILTDGRCMSYHSPTKTWKIWKPKKHIVISTNPRIKMLSKLNRLNKRVAKMLKPYQPRAPKTRLVPAGALSSIERKALKA